MLKLRFIVLILFHYVSNQMTECFIIKNQLEYHSFVDVYRWEFVAVAFIYNLSHLREMF